MKKLRLLLLSLLLVCTMAFFAGCGVKNPTEQDVIDALKDEGYIPDDEKEDKDDDEDSDDSDEADKSDENDSSDKADNKKSEPEYKVEITKNSLNDDKDKATVKADLKVTDEYTETVTEFKLTFKLKDKDKWKCREVEKGDSETKLKNGISDDEAKRLLEDWGYSVDDMYIYDDEIKSITVGEHEPDLENMEDVVAVTIEAEDGRFEVKFEAKVTFICTVYDGECSWNIQECEVVGTPETEIAESFKFNKTNDDIIADFTDEDEYEGIYFLGNSIDYCDVEISDFDAKIPEPDGSSSYIAIPCTFTMKTGEMTIDMEITVEYSNYGDGWEYSYIDDEEVVGWTSNIIGTWNGTDAAVAGAQIAIDIPDEFEDGDLYATVTVKTPANGTYSYKLEVYSYDAEDAEISTTFYEWITEPADGNTNAGKAYSGVISEAGVWEPEYSFYDFKFTKGGAAVDTPAPTEPAADVTPGEETPAATETPAA